MEAFLCDIDKCSCCLLAECEETSQWMLLDLYVV